MVVVVVVVVVDEDDDDDDVVPRFRRSRNRSLAPIFGGGISAK